MKKWLSGTPGKAVAAALCMLFGVLMIFGTVAAFALGSAGLLNDSNKELRRVMYQSVGDAYAARLLDGLDPDLPEESLSHYTDSNMQYAVIKTKDRTYPDNPKKEDYLYRTDPSVQKYDYFFVGSKEDYYAYNTKSLLGALMHPAHIVEKSFPDGEVYWILYNVREPLLSKEQCDDLFRQASDLADFLENHVGWMIPITLICTAITLLLFVFLLMSAGHRKNKEGIVLRLADRLPFEIYTVGVITVVGLEISAALEVAELFVRNTLDFQSMLLLVIALLVSCGLICLAWSMSLAVRLKAKKFWRYTILHYLLHPFARLPEAFRENVSFGKRVLLLLGGLSFLELLVIAATGYGAVMVIFLMYKVVEVPTLLWGAMQLSRIRKGTKKIASGESLEPISTEGMYWEFKKEAEDINHMGEGIRRAVEAKTRSERLKTELITNVSHDIKTPLTSIINYVDLLEKEEPENEKMKEYLEVLSRQSARLKKLIENLIEASKASTGNVEIHLEECDLEILLTQSLGEFSDKLQRANLEVLVQAEENLPHVMADGKSLWRVLENLLGNICKYAQSGTRVYVNLSARQERVEMILRNISSAPLNISSEQLMERFVRGDSSRNTEGNGLGLSIAQSLTELMGGKMKLEIDGDLFKVILEFQKKN